MSNAAIIVRIKEELTAFERKERTADQMERTLAAHFEALEGISYSTLKALHHFEYLLVKAQLADEEPHIEGLEAVVTRLRAALAEIEKEAKQSPQTTRAFGPRV